MAISDMTLEDLRSIRDVMSVGDRVEVEWKYDGRSHKSAGIVRKIGRRTEIEYGDIGLQPFPPDVNHFTVQQVLIDVNGGTPLETNAEEFPN